MCGMGERARRAVPADVDASCAVLADAFADYAWTRWTVDERDHAVRIASLQRLVVERIAMPYGEVWCADDDDGSIASVAVWARPDSPIPAPALRAIEPEQRRLEGDRHEASVIAEHAVAPLRPGVPHYYLGAVGTRADARCRGLGATVLRPVLDRAESDGIPAYLETSAASNVRFYEGLGFAVTAEIDLPGGGPHVWAMKRP